MLKQQRLTTLAALGLLAVVGWLWIAAPAAGSTERIVAIGDVHGAFDSLTLILREAGLIDDEQRWIGGRAILVQTGDFLDRGTDVRRVMDLLMDLQEQAPRHGGRVVVLMGNHEAMNLFGEYSGVTEQIYATFADNKSKERNRDAHLRWKVWIRQFEKRERRPTRAAWLAGHPPGLLEYRQALGPDGVYGRWLRQLPIAARLGGLVFVHGGFAPGVAPTSLEAINAGARDEIRSLDRGKRRLLDDGLILPFQSRHQIRWALARKLEAAGAKAAARSPGGGQMDLHSEVFAALAKGGGFAFRNDHPAWFRGFAKWSDDEGTAAVDELLLSYQASHFIVGHTPQKNTVKVRFDGRVFLIDTGMLTSVYRGRPSALVIEDGRFTAIYPEGDRTVFFDEADAATAAAAESPVPDPPVPARPVMTASPQANFWQGPDGEPLPFAELEEVLYFLRSARVVSSQVIPIGVTQPEKLVLERDGVRAHAVFRHRDILIRGSRMNDGSFVGAMRDSYVSEIAAFELGQLLGMDNVPPAVRRGLEGKAGSVQLWIEDTFTEQERQDRGLKPPDRLRFSRRIWDMRVFDNLIYNADRNLGNILIDPGWKVWLIDHTRAFSFHKVLFKPERIEKCSRGLWEGLRALSQETLEGRLGDHLKGFQIKALLARRDLVIELLEEKIAERGEAEIIFPGH